MIMSFCNTNYAVHQSLSVNVNVSLEVFSVERLMSEIIRVIILIWILSKMKMSLKLHLLSKLLLVLGHT